MIRHVTAPGLPPLAENMDELDPDNRIQDYSIPEVEFVNVKNYRAIAQVSPLAEGHCRLVWSCEGEAFGGVSDDEANQNMIGFYQMVMGWIGDYVGG